MSVRTARGGYGVDCFNAWGKAWSAPGIRRGREWTLRIELLDDEFLLPDLRSFLAAEGFFVAASDGTRVVEVFAPTVSSPIEAASRVSACANAWAALRGVPIAIDPPADRIANPLGERVQVSASRMGEPTVSIGLPVYNGARFLAETLDSLLGQTYADFELIVCDNASEDDTRQICEAYAMWDERIRFLPSDVNRGAAWNYNRALEAAAGRYFKWASHDDLCAPTYLERCVEVLDRAPDSVVLAYPKTVLIDKEGTLIGPYEDGMNLRQPEPDQRLRTLIRNLVLSNAVFGLIRKDALSQTRRHGAYISADYVLLAELALLGQFWEIPEPLFLRRDHPGMSRRANTSTSEVAEWFETGASAHQKRAMVRLSREYLRALSRSPDLSPLERFRAYGTLLPWLNRFRRGILLELTGPLLRPWAAAKGARGGAPVANIERFVVHDRIRAAVWSIAPDFVSQVRIHVDPQLTVDTDRAAFDRILLNLVSNAVRYGQSPITITADALQNDDFVLTIEDQGRGISPTFLPQIFEPFSRSNESEHASPGLGLGLAIARMSATESGGTLTSEPTDRGARFRLTLPGHHDPEDHNRRRPRRSAAPTKVISVG